MSGDLLRSGKATKNHYLDTFVHSGSGKLVMEDLVKAHHYNTSTFSSDPYLTAFREGERNVILRILTIISAPDSAFTEEKKNND